MIFKLKSKQKIFKLGDIPIGGPPGKNPTVLIGTIFYHKQNIFKDEKRGIFDTKAAESLINKQEEFSDKTGIPSLLDVVISFPDSIEKIIDFVANITDKPFLLDSPTWDIRVKWVDYVKEVGLSQRIIYNSIVPEYKDEEIYSIKDAGIKMAILLTFSSSQFTTSGRIQLANELLKVAENARIEVPLIDTCVLDIPSLGMACKALLTIKNELGLPVGCGAHNAIETWRGLKTKMGMHAIKPCIAVANALPAALGADFILYGPIDHADIVFPVVSMIDAAYAYLLLEEKEKIDKEHPLFKIA